MITDSLAARLRTALDAGCVAELTALVNVEPFDDHDAARALLQIGDVHLGSAVPLTASASLQHHPALATIAWHLDERFLEKLVRLEEQQFGETQLIDKSFSAGIRALSHLDQIPFIYEWLATTAPRDKLIDFLAFEGGPDGGFDDMVALCQIGMTGEPKVELARNYWDEMGNGRLLRVHTELYRKFATELGLNAIPRALQPLAALERAALGTILARHRRLQPELVGALGLIELQAGPRCRRVVAGLQRIQAPWDVVDFYAEHRDADPHHGKAWLYIDSAFWVALKRS